MKKRSLSLLLALIMALSLLPGAAWAAEGGSPLSGTFDSLQWKIDDDGILTISGSGAMRQMSNSTSYPWYSYRELITKVVIEDGVTSVAHGILYQCSAISISIPASVTDMSYKGTSTNPFHVNCDSKLNEILVDPGNAAFTSADGVLYSKDMRELISYPQGRTDPSYTIPDSVVYIGQCAFARNKSLSSVTIPDRVTTIDYGAFMECTQLETLELPDTVTSVGGNAFVGCKSLKSVKLSNNLGVLEDYVFGSCTDLTSITIPASVTAIKSFAFSECQKLDNVSIPSSVTSLGDCAFQDCAFSSIFIPKSVVSFEGDGGGTHNPFHHCSNLSDIYYGGSAEEWANISGASQMTSSDGKLYTVTLGASKTAEIHYDSTSPGGQDPDPTVETKNASGVLRSGDGCRVLWQCSYQVDANGRSQNASVKIFTSSTDAIQEELFLYNESTDTGLPFPWELEPHNIPKSAVTTLSIDGESTKQLRIPSRAFQGYDHLSQAVLNNVSGIDSYAFEGCVSLRSVGFSNETLKSVGGSAFANCSALGTITLDRSVAAIGNGAFSGCSNVKIRCYEKSPAHQHAVENNIPFELLDNALDHTDIYCGTGEPESFEHDLDHYVMQTPSTTYSPELSHMLIALSCAAYDEYNIRRSISSLGFSDSNTLYSYANSTEKDPVAYSFGQKQLDNGKKLVLIVIRGTSGDLEWASNFDTQEAVLGCFWHKGFSVASEKVYNSLIDFCGGSFNNTCFVITGHSRGAAVANLLEVRLSNAHVSKENVYGYNFACPDVATGLPTGWNWLGEHNNMFNIGNSADPVSVVPGVIGSTLHSIIPTNSWGKFGQSRWFSNDWNSIYETALDVTCAAHDQRVYLKYLGQKPGPSFNSFKTWEDRMAAITVLAPIQTIGKQFSVFCPVDVLITDVAGDPIASVINGEEKYYSSKFGEVLILKSEDKKIFFVQGNEPLTIHLVATDSGKMDYIVQTVNLDLGIALSEKAFTEVDLFPQKGLLSLTDVENITGVGRAPKRLCKRE